MCLQNNIVWLIDVFFTSSRNDSYLLNIIDEKKKTVNKRNETTNLLWWILVPRRHPYPFFFLLFLFFISIGWSTNEQKSVYSLIDYERWEDHHWQRIRFVSSVLIIPQKHDDLIMRTAPIHSFVIMLITFYFWKPSISPPESFYHTFR